MTLWSEQLASVGVEPATDRAGQQIAWPFSASRGH